MGITNLLPQLRSITTYVDDLSRYSGRRAGIDVSGWLYKGAYGGSVDLAQGIPTECYITYCLDRLNMLSKYNITPLVVFDGSPLPKKRQTNVERQAARDAARARGFAYLAQGQDEAGQKSLSRSVCVTPDMVRALIETCKDREIEYLIAPYEADAQLAYLSKERLIDLVISEDSDCLPYGCRTMLFKLSLEHESGEEIKRRNLGASELLNFQNWTEEMFLQMCILAGCDYVPNVPGIGIKSAYHIVRAHEEPHAILKALENTKGSSLPSDFAQQYVDAIMTFRHHRVYCPTRREVIPLNPFDTSQAFIKTLGTNSGLELDLDLNHVCRFLGPDIPASVATKVVRGHVRGVFEAPHESSKTVTSGGGGGVCETTTKLLPREETHVEKKKKKNGTSSVKRPKTSRHHYSSPFVSEHFHALHPRSAELDYEDHLNLKQFEHHAHARGVRKTPRGGLTSAGPQPKSSGVKEKENVTYPDIVTTNPVEDISQLQQFSATVNQKLSRRSDLGSHMNSNSTSESMKWFLSMNQEQEKHHHEVEQQQQQQRGNREKRITTEFDEDDEMDLAREIAAAKKWDQILGLPQDEEM